MPLVLYSRVGSSQFPKEQIVQFNFDCFSKMTLNDFKWIEVNFYLKSSMPIHSKI